MNIKRTILGLTIALLTLGVVGCDEYGKVDQGRVIDFDKDKQTATIIQDKAMDARNPDYSVMPPHTYTMPSDPAELQMVVVSDNAMRIFIRGKTSKCNALKICNQLL